jgi:large subunit ribosomal protein L13
MSMQKSYYPTQKDLADQQWFLVDAEGATAGRLASRIAALLRGKNQPTYTPSVAPNIYVVVVNADKVRLTGRKWTEKVYYRHTNWPGGLKSTTPRALEEKKPGEVLRVAVHGMLPKNKLGSIMKTHLRIFAGPTHTHEAQQPVKIDLGPAVQVA